MGNMKHFLVCMCLVACSSEDVSFPIQDASSDMPDTTIDVQETSVQVELCCDQNLKPRLDGSFGRGTLEACNEAQPWTCRVMANSQFTWDCTTPLCSVGDYCIGISGAGVVVGCKVETR